jgi:hypothetical protein
VLSGIEKFQKPAYNLLHTLDIPTTRQLNNVTSLSWPLPRPVRFIISKKELAMLHPPQEDNAVVTRLSEDPGRLKSCLDMIKAKRRVYLRLLAHLRAAADEAERSRIPEQPDVARR